MCLLGEVLSDVRKLTINKAMSPDGILNKLLKEFAPIIVPHLQSVTEERICSGPFKAGYCYACPPPPPPPPPQDITSDLRPISLTSCLAKVIEGFTYGLLEQLSNDMDPRKYACHGHSTTQALSTSDKQFTKQWTHEISLLDFLC